MHTPFRRLFFLCAMSIVGCDGYILLTCATNLSPREVELIRIRIADTYFNARAYINLFKMRTRERGREERKRGDKGGQETMKSRVNER